MTGVQTCALPISLKSVANHRQPEIFCIKQEARRNDNRYCVYRPTNTYWMTCFTSAKNTKLWPFSSAVTTAKQDSLLQDCILEIISLSYKKSYPPMVKKEATPIKQFVNQQR